MADLIDRISRADELRKINLHRWIGCQRLYAFGEWTRTDLATEFDLQGLEITQAAQIADNIDAQSNANSKALYIARVEAVLLCVEPGDDRLYHDGNGVVNKTKVFEDLQISGS